MYASKHNKKKFHILCINCITRKIVLNFLSLSTSDINEHYLQKECLKFMICNNFKIKGFSKEHLIDKQ